MAKKRREAGQGLLRKRKDGRWEGRIVIDYDEKGLPITKTVTSKSKTECQAKMEKLKESLGKTNNKINSKMPFGLALLIKSCIILNLFDVLFDNL